jgi:hypothetical protein
VEAEMNIGTRRLAGALAIVVVVFGSALPADATPISIDPKATYLRTNFDPGSLDTIPLDLAVLGFSPGQTIFLQQLGDFDCGPPCVDDRTAMIGVFSSSSTLLANTNQSRVSGAIDAGTDVGTAATHFGGLVTDIPQDFFISGTGTTVVIPTGAAYLFVAAHDSLYNDNFDPDVDYAVHLESVAVPVPEPSTLLLLGMGVVGAALRRRRRQDGPQPAAPSR